MQVQEKIIPLVMTCLTGCGNTRVIESWVHASCNKQVFLKGNGNLMCLNGCADESICKWRFKCEKHQGDYKDIDFNALIDALGTAIKSTKAFFKDDREGLLFLAEVQKNIYQNM